MQEPTPNITSETTWLTPKEVAYELKCTKHTMRNNDFVKKMHKGMMEDTDSEGIYTYGEGEYQENGKCELEVRFQYKKQGNEDNQSISWKLDKSCLGDFVTFYNRARDEHQEATLKNHEARKEGWANTEQMAEEVGVKKHVIEKCSVVALLKGELRTYLETLPKEGTKPVHGEMISKDGIRLGGMISDGHTKRLSDFKIGTENLKMFKSLFEEEQARQQAAKEAEPPKKTVHKTYYATVAPVPTPTVTTSPAEGEGRHQQKVRNSTPSTTGRRAG